MLVNNKDENLIKKIKVFNKKTMSMEDDNQDEWGSRKILLAAMLCQTLGVNTVTLLPHQAINYGAAGHIFLYGAIYVFIGIPLLYMEYVTGQFTGRNCLEVWRARPCLSHVAYVQIFWQIMNLITSNLLCSFVIHYFLISFERPIPYYECGPWSNKKCNFVYSNYTIQQDCMNTKERKAYCINICTTFPEYQYWRHYILGLNTEGFYLAWRVSLASLLLCIILGFSCFKTNQAYKWVLGFYTVFLISTRFIFLVGSLLQKGVVVKFEEAFDTDFSLFMKNIEFPSSTVEVLFSLNVGSGIGFNLASKTSFRSPCYSNTVLVVVISAAITIIGICNKAIMLCPYSFKHGVHPLDVAKYPMYNTYELVPRLLYIYESNYLWLILFYSAIAISFMCVNTIVLSSLLEDMLKKYLKAGKYPGMTTVSVVTIMFIFSIPLLGNKILHFILDLQRGVNFLLIFTVTIECFVFLLCYGFGRFCEDVHFMLGVQPRPFVKLFWVVSIFVLCYVFGTELYTIYVSRYKSLGTQTAWWVLIIIVLITIFVAIIKVSRAAYKKRLREEVGLDPTWGPKSDVLKRSRAMFTTHAMTKEYIYRQYHIQAGILMRQRRCNIRA